MKTARNWIGFAVLLAFPGRFVQSTIFPPTLSICDIRSRPQNFLGQVVTVSGEVEASFHVTDLSSPSCIDFGAALVESHSMRQSAASERFRVELETTRGCTDDRPFVVTVQGRFGTANIRGLPTYRILVEKVLRAEFVEGLSRHCMSRDVSPPDIKIPPQPMPLLFP